MSEEQRASGEAVVVLDDRLLLKTHYGGMPFFIGKDLYFGQRTPEGIIKAARMWEVGYLAARYRDVAKQEIPEARFTQGNPRSKFYVRLVGEDAAADLMEKRNEVTVYYIVGADDKITVVFTGPDTGELCQTPLEGWLEDFGWVDSERYSGPEGRIAGITEGLHKDALRSSEVLSKYMDIFPELERLARREDYPRLRAVRHEIGKTSLELIELIKLVDAVKRDLSEKRIDGKEAVGRIVKFGEQDERGIEKGEADRLIESLRADPLTQFKTWREITLKRTHRDDQEQGRTRDSLVGEGLDEPFITNVFENQYPRVILHAEVLRRKYLR